MHEKIYIKLDKPIEVGDLVRCVEHDAGCWPGEIREVSHVDTAGTIFFCLRGQGRPHVKQYWEPVCEKAAMAESDRAEMKQEVSDMIVELIDRKDKENFSQSPVRIYNWQSLDNTITVVGNDFESYEAEPPVGETWDTLTGIYVALCKATGRKLPNWACGEEQQEKKEGKTITLDDVLEAWRSVEPGFKYRDKIMNHKDGMRFIFPSGVIYEISTEEVHSNREVFGMKVDQNLRAINLTVEYLKQRKEIEDE